MPHPKCGKCHSAGVYKDYDPDGQPVIACLMCGNRYPGAGKGFYMSGNESPSVKNHPEVADVTTVSAADGRARKMCAICGLKPTISDSCPYCPSCMRKKSIESRKQKIAPVRPQRKKTEEDKAPAGKTPVIENMKVDIDFSRFPAILEQLQELSDQELRPLDLQVIYILKQHLSQSKSL